MELLELVNVVVGKGLDQECPFPHFPAKPPKDKNKWTNSSSALGTSLDAEWKSGKKLYLPHLEEAPIATGASGKPNYVATYNPHHLIPGDASWPKTSLKKWMDEGHVEHDIGYNVNGYRNGIDLPSSNEMRGNWTFRTPDFQNRYAFAAMRADSRTRQFHDAHKAYSDFVIKALEKVAARITTLEVDGGCGDDNCAMKGKKKPFPTPVDLLPRVYGICQRLSGYLWGNAKKWHKPLFTSRFALMYKNKGLTQEQATEQLNPDNFTY